MSKEPKVGLSKEALNEIRDAILSDSTASYGVAPEKLEDRKEQNRNK